MTKAMQSSKLFSNIRVMMVITIHLYTLTGLRIRLKYVLYQDDSWHKIFPLTVVDEIQKTHFVHNCNMRCKDDHDPNNNQYLKNDFFFTAI